MDAVAFGHKDWDGVREELAEVGVCCVVLCCVLCSLRMLFGPSFAVVVSCVAAVTVL